MGVAHREDNRDVWSREAQRERMAAMGYSRTQFEEATSGDEQASEQEVYRPFVNLLEAMKAKDPELYAKVSSLTVGRAVDEWQKAYPEDFPLGGMSPATAASIIPKAKNID